MPWQRHVADVAGELRPDGSYAYRTVIVTVQRQAGKTTLLAPVNLETCLYERAAKCWLTAQTRQDARDTWNDVADAVKASPLVDVLKVRRSNGSEGITGPAASFFRVFAPVESALHGKANHRVTIDEAWHFTAAEGLALDQAILPTFTTTGGQLWIVSTAGTAASAYLRRYVELGRAAVEAGRTEGVAHFECGVDEAGALAVMQGLADDATPAARQAAVDVVLAAHPGNGYTLRRDALEQATDGMSAGEFLRAYGNHWTRTSDQVIPAHAWEAAHAETWPKPEPGVALAFDVPLDRNAQAAIAAAWRDSATGPMRVQVIETCAPGQLAARMLQLIATWRPIAVGFDDAGPARDVADELQRAGVELAPTNTRAYTAACAGLLSDVVNGRLTHCAQPVLDDAVANAASRPLGDAWAWSRRDSAESIAPLVAVTVARWAWDHRPAPPVKPRMR